MANKPHEFPVFSPLDKAAISLLLSKLNSYLSNFIATSGISDLSIQDNILYEIFERIEKRRIYFHIFYNGCKMGELNEGALMCFWIRKLTPFTSSKMPASVLNARISLNIFFNMLFYVAKTGNRKVNCTKQIIDDLFYAFCYRDLSKEAIMALAESLIY
ncbi:MAG: hypothetical protein LBK44_01520 [Spirochaetales bacterium]|jgi:hypothetical protein|nr:hypothetical protein [Spirochaetales bacterium]